MKDLKFEQKRSLSRQEAADQLTALADALREGGDAELELGPGTLGLRIPDDLRSEMEVEIGDGEIELEIELKWATAPTRARRSDTDAPGEKPRRKTASAGTGRSGTGRSGTGTGKTRSTKRSAAKSA
ncbi:MULTISPECIES: amphi-Trp domain-containing protein [Streptomyces]|uniref:amphi-Trp domain-containing protein n=1 Tax=Streptomyces TaxID=1883 RepID=UPI000CF27EA0|nr:MULTISPECIES: amphi-Trp domain-containing protein [Streptomyces]PPS75486.1 amphi-Trp domain-containing protein [Streptomyces sp. 46]